MDKETERYLNKNIREFKKTLFRAVNIEHAEAEYWHGVAMKLVEYLVQMDDEHDTWYWLEKATKES